MGHAELVEDLVAASRHATDAELAETSPAVLQPHGLPESLFAAVMATRRLSRQQHMRDLQAAYDDAIAAAVANA